MATPQVDRGSVIEGFARTLFDVRTAAGQPSYRKMAQQSGCISHTTLHEATRGQRLPSWETTEQFLLACGADPEGWKQEWERADRLVNGTGPTSISRPVTVSPGPAQRVALAPGDAAQAVTSGAPTWMRMALLALTAIVLVLIGVFVGQAIS